MQDEDRLHDQVELALDNRQIFLLFTASAVVLSLVFALGVVVGKRLSPVVAAQPKSDPLAMLDRAGAAQDDELSFPQALAGDGSKTAAATDKAAGAAAGVAPAKGAVVAVGKAAKETKGSQSKGSQSKDGSPKVAPAPAKPVVAPRAPSPPPARVVPPAAPQQPERRLAAGGKQKAPKAAKGARVAKGKAKGDEGETGMRYTLQLSSFQDRHEAEQFMAKLRKKGHEVAMVPTRIPGRGLWYRVRLGTYTNWKVALEAKVSFERDEKSIAYVAKF